MNLLTFLGTADYKPTTYTLDGQPHPTKYCPAAIAHFYRPEKTFVIVTELAAEKHFETLADEIANVTQPIPVPIPDGHSEVDLWAIFNQLTNHVAEGDELVVDITNGFRSLPFLSFLAVAFLRMARQVKVQRILYGAWEARDGDQPTNHTPIFDLTPFLTLLDWTIATDRFTQTGDGRPLATLLQQAGQFEHPKRALTPIERTQQSSAQKIIAAANAISNTSGTLLATMIPNAQYQSHLLNIRLRQAETGLFAELPPYRLLSRQIEATYGAFGVEKPMQDDIPADLVIQLKMLRWYIDNGQIPQAVTLMREWVVTAVGYYLGMRLPQLLDYKTGRKFIEGAINLFLKDPLPENLPEEITKYLQLFSKLENAEAIARFWHDLIDIRNLVDHGAMRKNWRDYDPHKIATQMTDKYEALLALELQFPASYAGTTIVSNQSLSQNSELDQ